MAFRLWCKVADQPDDNDAAQYGCQDNACSLRTEGTVVQIVEIDVETAVKKEIVHEANEAAKNDRTQAGNNTDEYCQ
ncbi:MAG: hypothetical protein OWQ56_11085 [Acidithiobacillus caldus]|nr:hypothetical protein [Acidithiobacillus caldus]